MSAAALIVQVNQLLQTILALGLSWAQLAPLVEKAQAEGRQFGSQDLDLLQRQLEEKLAKLRLAVEQAKAEGR